MSSRETLLRAVFAALDQQKIGYCISRNAATVFEEGSSDVDLVIEPRNLERAFVTCRKAAITADYRLISRTRFANLSLVFWKAGGHFLRIDFETEIRWRIWPIASAADILRNVKMVQGVPSTNAAAEIAVLVTKTLWAGKITERYHGRLEDLNSAEVTVDPILPFPMVEAASAGNIHALRRMVIGRVITNPRRWASVLRNGFHDLLRVSGRTIAPPGVYLSVHVSEPFPGKELASLMEMAFPPAKACWGRDDTDIKNVAKALFRGGLVVQEILDADATAFQKRRVRNPGLWMAAKSHRFCYKAPPECAAFLGHLSTGRMWPIDRSRPESDLADGIAEAMAGRLDPAKTPRRSGIFAVLVGLDGAGKTTFARNLCTLPSEKTGFKVIRYFHWMPKWRKIEFPWPTSVETRRKTPKSGKLPAAVSVLRLCHHIIMAHMRCLLVTTPAVRRGELVLIDRFLYNYWLDPVSLKYSGPAWCLRLASVCMPKPDLILSLEAGTETILSRKNELSREEIAIQSDRLRRLPLRGIPFVVIDAAQSPDQMVEEALRALTTR